MAAPIIREHKYRKYGTMKDSVRFHTTVPQDVIDFFEENALNEEGRKRSRGEILQMLVEIAKEKLSNLAQD